MICGSWVTISMSLTRSKYERSKQQMEALKKSEELLLADKQQAMEQAAAQEERYDKLKKHAMQQMEM